MPRQPRDIQRTGLREALSDLLAALSRQGDVTVTARVAGATFSIRLADEAPHGGRAAGARTIAEEAGLPSPTQVLDLLRENPLGLRLKELARRFGVAPRNRLKPVIARLIEDRTVRPAGRRFRATDVVVKRGRKPASASGDARRRRR